MFSDGGQGGKNIKNKLTTLLLGFVCLLLTIIMWTKESVPRSDDFLHYWTAARYLKLYGPSNIYSQLGEQAVFDRKHEFTEVTDNQFEIVHTPLLYAAVSLISSGAIETDARRFHTISLICYVFAIAMLSRMFKYSLNGALLLYIFILHFTPKIMDSYTSNLTSIQLGILVVLLAFLQLQALWGHLAVGVLFGFLVLLKPNTVFIPIFLIFSRLIRRQWRFAIIEAFGGLIGATAGIFIGATLFESVFCWLDWAERMKLFPIKLFEIDHGNFSLPFLLEGITGNDNVMNPVMMVGMIAVAIRIAQLNIKFLQVKKTSDLATTDDVTFDVQILVSACIAWLLYMNLVWTYYYTFTVPMIILLISAAWRQKKAGVGLFATVFAISSMQLPMLFNAPSLVSAWLMWSGAFVLFLQGTASPAHDTNLCTKYNY